MGKLLDRWFSLGWQIIGIGASIILLPFTIVIGLVMAILNKLF